MNPPQKRAIVYHKTSTDIAKINQTTISLAGHKREYRDLEDNQPAPVDITERFEFRRPTVDSGLGILKAGEIYDVLSRSQGPSEYSQRRCLALTPNPTSNSLLELSHPAYGLPKQLVANFESLGINSIYPWQSDCLLKSGALHGDRNLVYTAPTGGGKSLVADVLMLKRVIECPGQKAILVLPYVALVQEKLRWLRKVVDGITKTSDKPRNMNRPQHWQPRGDEDLVRVAGFFGGSKVKASWNDIDIAVCTIEKANSLVNTAIEECTISKLGVVVIDELHMLDDESRGYILELMATKLLSLEQNVQLVGMSATLNNADVLAKWLGGAKFYLSRYKPVPVEEHLVFDNSIYSASTAKNFYNTATQLNKQTQGQSQRQTQLSSQIKPEPIRAIQPSLDKQLNNPLVNAVVALANETARSGYGALVFCSSRSQCENDALLISQVLPRPEETDSLLMEKRLDLLGELRGTSTGLDPFLGKTIPVGVAFHHAGLTTEERDLVAAAYDAGVIKVIVATCSLAAGINLPARRVILKGARMGAELVGPSMLRQMRGRAGRKGKDEIGETYLCCDKSDLEAVAELMEADIPNVESCLLPEKRGIKGALLEIIATKLATSNGSVDDYMKKTLLCHSIDRSVLASMVSSTIKELLDDSLITQPHPDAYRPTLLGSAVVASSLAPEDGLFIHRELRRALSAFVMDGDLHVLYLFTPVQSSPSPIDWRQFRHETENLSEADMRALEFIGLSPAVINRMAQGGSMKESTSAEIETARIYRRFYAALQLRDLCNEIPVHTVAKRYDIPRGIVQNLAQTCHGFAAGMIKFCQRMEWGALAAVLDHFSDRLRAGAKTDLLALAQVTFIKSKTARCFWENGFKSVAALAAADVKDILPVLLLAQPKRLKTKEVDVALGDVVMTEEEQERKYLARLRAKAEIIIQSANRIWEKQLRDDADEELE